MGLQKIGSFVFGIISTFDMFGASVGLRLKQSSGFSTLFTGLVSLAMMVGFIVLFYSQFLALINYENITVSMSSEEDYSGEMVLDDILFAFTVQNLNLKNLSQHFFQFQVKEQTYINGTHSTGLDKNFRLINCNITQWHIEDQPQIRQLFSSLKMNQMLCLPSNETITFRGHQSSEFYTTIQILISKCQNLTISSCAPQAAIDQFFVNQLLNSDYLEFKIYLLDTKIHGSQIDMVQRKIQQKLKLPFTKNIGALANINFGKYQVVTDTSLLPITVQSTQTYNFLESTQVINYQVLHDTYITLNLLRSPTTIMLSRSFGKIDYLLGYIGGLLGLVVFGVSIFIGSYNQYCYELSIGEALFKHSRESKQGNFNFIHYLGYQLYSYLLIFGINLNWNRMRSIHEAREEVNEQLDIGLIMKRLNYFQRVSEVLLDEHHYLALFLARPQTTETIKKIRQTFEVAHKMLNQEQVDLTKWNDNQNLTSHLDITFEQNGDRKVSPNNIDIQVEQLLKLAVKKVLQSKIQKAIEYKINNLLVSNSSLINNQVQLKNLTEEVKFQNHFNNNVFQLRQ